MEELEYKLNSNNPIIIAHIFSKITQKIQEGNKTGMKDISELKFLKDKCMVPDPLINEVASVAIINLVNDGVLPLDTTLADFITSIPLTKCLKSLINIIGSLLLFDLKSKVDIQKEYINNYNLWLPQHPYITILNENPNTSNYILNELKYLGKNENCKYVNEIFRPVYLYALCNPFSTNTHLLKQGIWNILLSRSNLDKTLLFEIFSLLQVETRNTIEENTELLIEATSQIISSNNPNYNVEILILWQASFLYNLAKNKLDLRPCLSSLTIILQNVEKLTTINCLLVILTKTIPICSSVYLLDLLNLCKRLLSYDKQDVYILESLKVPLLHWMANPSTLTTEANKVANYIFVYIEELKISDPKDSTFDNFVQENRRLISTNNIVSSSVEICLLLPHFEQEGYILQWIKKLEQSSSSLVANLYNFLCGLFLSSKLESEVSIKVFELILKYVEHSKILSSELLTLILFKLSNITDSKLHFILLKALPKMVFLRDNIPVVMSALQALSKSSADMYNFSLSLVFDAWKVDNKCYSHLEAMLIQDNFSERKWETYVTKSFIIKELCKKKPELYGKEMVAHLSKILNECNDDDGSLPCGIALDGIRILCKAEIIDVITTWATLAPKFKTDRRISVIKGLCSLIHEIPSLPYTESYMELQNEVVHTLWDYVNTGDPEIIGVALNSLTSFSLEQICSQLPEKYLDENVLQERSRVVGIPQTVPGKCWVKFLIENRASKETSDFLIKMISIEVTGYLKYVYQVKGHKEPVNYDYLPTHSIVRGIGEYIRTVASKWTRNIHDLVYIECLKIFSMEYSKPLPPLNWCFLQELLHDPRIKDYCIDIAAHQSILSGSARRLIENYIIAVTENLQESDIINVLRNLKHLANSIQPITLKPFLENAITFSIDKYQNDEKDLLQRVLDQIKKVLQNTDIQETNKTTIAQVLSDKVAILEIRSELFDALLECVIVLPKKCIDEITNIKSGVSEEWLEKVTKIRCSIACQAKESPLVWLNDVIETSSLRRRNGFILDQFIKVFKTHINNPSECALWLLELIGQIQAKVAERCSEQEVVYYFDLFILTVIEFSGYFIYIIDENGDKDAKRKELFPQAFNLLLSSNDWSICTMQALEWLFHMNTEDTIPVEYKNLFGLTLWALRHDEEFIKNFRWMKYLSSKVIINCS